MTPLVGLVGRARSGKDTFADVLVEEHSFAKLALADPLREMAASIDPVVGWEPTFYPDGDDRVSIGAGPTHYRAAVAVYGYERAKDRYPELRRFLQRLGTEGIRGHVADDYWVREAERRIQASADPVVVTDVRFANEAEMIRRNGGLLVGLLRGEASEPSHSSEAVDDLVYGADVIVDNNGTREQYLATVRQHAGFIAARA